MGNVQSGAALDPYTAIGGCTASSALIAVATVIVNALSPTPHHYNCNVHGQLNPSKASAAAVTTITSASCANTNAPVYFAPNKGIDYCRDQCFAAGPTGCISFEYDADTDTCVFFDVPLPRVGLRPAKNPPPVQPAKTQYNYHCFTTTSTMVTPTATEYSWCSATPSVTVQLTDPSISYPGKCLGQDDRGPHAPNHVDFLEWDQDLPFPVQLYSNTFDSFTITTQGALLFDSSPLFPLDLPNSALPLEYPNPSQVILPLWQRQQVNNGTDAQISYSIVGPVGARIITWSWTTASQDGGAYDYSGPGAQSYAYNVVYNEGSPGVWEFLYGTATDRGVQATIGAQLDAQDGGYTQYSFHEASISPNAILRLDTTAADPQWVEV